MIPLPEQSADTAKANWPLLIRFALHVVVCCGAVAWVCWPSLVRMESTWTSLPQYSHGYLVPLFAAYLLWHRRAELVDEGLSASLWGLPWIGVGLAMKWAGTAFFVDFVDDIAIIVLLWGALLTAGGGRGLSWGWQGVMFLAFMVPLPFRLETELQQSLLHFATSASTYSLQTLGYPAFSDGNLIHLPASKLGVLDACSGLRMGIVCTAMAVLAAMVSTAPGPQRVLIFLSGIPLALLTNILRITAMGVASEHYGQDAAERMFHDASGYVMIVLAVIGLVLEYRLLTWIYDIPEDDEHRKPMFAQQRV